MEYSQQNLTATANKSKSKAVLLYTLTRFQLVVSNQIGRQAGNGPSLSLLYSSLFFLPPESCLHTLQTRLTVLFLNQRHFEFQVSSESKSTEMVNLCLKRILTIPGD